MGGVSDGRFRMTERQTLEFYGTLSLENNGGFASVSFCPRFFYPTLIRALRSKIRCEVPGGDAVPNIGTVSVG